MSTLPARFWAKVAQEQPSGCWIWTAGLSPDGYGKFSSGGRYVRAHRLAYSTLIGPIPPGLHLDHLCRVRRCVNPAHLEPVTHRENILRGATLPAANAAKTHCPQGHAYDEANTHREPDGRRRCRICQRATKAASRARRRAARAAAA
ncbi:HNH endonuclease signature motif containing protein [Streptomyces roseus]|uniref:HNH endonuclease signature motif containing protein n=1 Tax=Streptomyces roseus TaxID=66430 RepID=UPI003814D844